jgi:hypothetical protein
MLTLKDNIVSFVTPNSIATYEMAGENMLEARGEIRVITLIRASKDIFLLGAKFWGLLGSSCPSQPTIPRLRSVSGNICLVCVDVSAVWFVDCFSRSGVRFLTLSASLRVP